MGEEFLSQKSRFSAEQSTKGFDNSAGDKWIYPDNYPLREYQFNIVKTALYHNTLVCLPTGLGKTFIAAVVMYNFWRWYPKGKIVFLAPTKPLVAQQISACYEVMGIASEETIELTGTVDQKKRQIAWSTSSRARVVFATPQIFHNDLEKNIIPAELVKCVVIDEAHKALGKHSYCESIRLLNESNKYFRVLGLSATPGSKLNAVQDVIRNLLISRLELRDDTSPDIVPYINERKLDVILIGLGDDLETFRDRYVVIMDPHVRVLIENNVLRGNTTNISKGRIFMILKDWKQKQDRGSKYGIIMKTLTILLTMYHAYELLIRHGLRAFYNFYQKHDDKFWLNDEPALIQLLEEINYFLGPFPDIHPMPDGSLPNIPEDIRFGHNKFYKLREILLKHFEKYESKEENTRAIVFVEFRDIVNEIYVLLLQSMPLIRPQKFVGQAGQKRKEQNKALEDFRTNKVNVLISTSVGEEGLDVGEVNLIVCFDISQVSPIRLVQRMGRTGRKQDGHVIALVTDGKEYQTLKSSMSRRDSLNNKVLHSSGIVSALYPESPRMVPEEFNPECRKTSVIVCQMPDASSRDKEKTIETKKRRKRQGPSTANKNTKKDASCSNQLMTKYLKRGKDENEMEILANSPTKITPSLEANREQVVSNNLVKLGDVKLLYDDDAAVEFLTLCTMKRTQTESIIEKRKNPRWPSYYETPERLSLDFEIPNLVILDCLERLERYVEPGLPRGSDEARFWLDERFDDPEAVETSVTRFEALLDTSDDSDATINRNVDETTRDLPIDEKVDWAEDCANFEGCLDEWSIEDVEEDSTKTAETSKNQEKILTSEHSEKHESTSSAIVEEPAIKLEGFEDLLNEDSDSEKTDSDATVDGLTRKSVFEGLISEDSSTRSDIVMIDEPNDLGPAETTKDSCKRIAEFEDMLNSSSEGEQSRLSVDLLNNKDEASSSASLRPKSTEIENKILEYEVMENSAKSTTERARSDVFETRAEKLEIMKEDRKTSEDQGHAFFKPQLNSTFVESATGREAALCVPRELDYSDKDIFEADDFLVNSDFEEQVERIERSAVEGNASERKTINFDTDSKDRELKNAENCEREKKSAEESKDSPRKSFRLELNLEEARSNVSIVEAKDDERKRADKSLRVECSVESNDWGTFSIRDVKTSPIVTKVFNDQENPAGPSNASRESGKTVTRSREDRSTKPRISLSRKLSRNIGSSDWTRRIGARSVGNDSDSENDFFVGRVETTVTSGRDCFLKPDPVPARNFVKNFSRNPLSARPNEMNLEGQKEFSARDRCKATGSSNERVLGAGRQKSASCDLETRKRRKRDKHEGKRARVRSEFIDYEAEISSEGEYTSGSSGDDRDLESFVSYTQQVEENVDMQAHYLQTIRSPRGPGAFCFRKPRSPRPGLLIYSQPEPDETNDYINDSFCVDGEVFEEDETSDELSRLEELEKELRRKKRKRAESSDSRGKRKRKVLVSVDDESSSEDEMEKIRRQIREETP